MFGQVPGPVKMESSWFEGKADSSIPRNRRGRRQGEEAELSLLAQSQGGSRRAHELSRKIMERSLLLGQVPLDTRIPHRFHRRGIPSRQRLLLHVHLEPWQSCHIYGSRKVDLGGQQ